MQGLYRGDNQADENSSPLIEWGGLSSYADKGELRFREEEELYDKPEEQVADFIRRRSLVERFGHVLKRSGYRPQGIVGELGAGSCWLCWEVSKPSEVVRVYAVDSSRGRLTLLAPIAMRFLNARKDKIVRIDISLDVARPKCHFWASAGVRDARSDDAVGL